MAVTREKGDTAILAGGGGDVASPTADPTVARDMASSAVEGTAATSAGAFPRWSTAAEARDAWWANPRVTVVSPAVSSSPSRPSPSRPFASLGRGRWEATGSVLFSGESVAA